MGSISKHCLNSSTSNEETHDHHHRPEKFKGENHGAVVVGRFYECNFCKRGFTNAQALGGHMNIHRKDKDRVSNNSNTNNNKIKQKTWKNSMFSVSKSGDDYDEEECKNSSSLCRYEDQIMDCFRFINYVPSANYSSINPNLSKLGFEYTDPSNDSTVNLSIQIDQHSYYSNIQEDTSEGRENELDLELRLG